MKITKSIAASIVILWARFPLSAQDKKPVNLAAAAPNILLLVQEGLSMGRATDRKKLGTSMSRACDRIEVQRFWIDMEPLTGEPTALVFSSFDSYEQLEQSNFDWRQFLAGHPELARIKEELAAMGTGENTTIAVRRDDLGYLSGNIDLSEARFVQVLKVRLFPGHEDDFAQAYKILADANAKIQADSPWVVYEVDAGAPAPTFLVLRPMSELKLQDDLQALNRSLIEAEGEQDRDTLRKIEQEAYADIENTIYAVDPEMSHVSKAFAITDPEFWIHRADAQSNVPPESKSTAERSK